MRSGEAAKWADRYERQIRERLAAGETSFTLESGTLEDSTYNDDVRKALCACYLSQKNGWHITYSVEDKTFSVIAANTVLQLPESLTRVGKDAFSNIAADAIAIPAGMEQLSDLPTDLVWYCHTGSAALTYAQEHGIPYVQVP